MGNQPLPVTPSLRLARVSAHVPSSRTRQAGLYRRAIALPRPAHSRRRSLWPAVSLYLSGHPLNRVLLGVRSKGAVEGRAMPVIEERIVIDRSRDEVFNFYADPDKMPL